MPMRTPPPDIVSPDNGRLADGTVKEEKDQRKPDKWQQI